MAFDDLEALHHPVLAPYQPVVRRGGDGGRGGEVSGGAFGGVKVLGGAALCGGGFGGGGRGLGGGGRSRGGGGLGGGGLGPCVPEGGGSILARPSEAVR